jgi:hypothetical protein
MGCTAILVRGRYVYATQEIVGVSNEATGKKVQKYVVCLMKAHKAGEWAVHEKTNNLRKDGGWGATTPNTKCGGY